MARVHRIPRAGLMTISAFRRLYENGMADFERRADPVHNLLPVLCRVCRVKVPTGKAFGYDEYMTDGYRFSRRFVCAGCKDAAALKTSKEAP